MLGLAGMKPQAISNNRRRPRRLGLGGGLLVLAAAICAPLAAGQTMRVSDVMSGSYSGSVMSWRDIPFRTVIRQQFDYSCGSAALATLLRFQYGVHVGESEIFQAMYAAGDQARIREVGFSMLDMKRYLEAQGYAADGLRLNLDRIAAFGQPVIALVSHDNYRHFVVIKGVDGGRVLVGDPTFGLRVFARADFEAIWNGVVLAIRRGPDGAASAPIFNLDSDWRPWPQAPMDMAEGPRSPADLLRELPTIYQITPTAMR
ncbi:MAG: C39 family peptidase [Hyphomonadaceae bacterium]